MKRHLMCLSVVLLSSQWTLGAPIYLEAEATIASAGYLGEDGWQDSDTQGGTPPAERFIAERYVAEGDGHLEWERSIASWSGFSLVEVTGNPLWHTMYMTMSQVSVIGASEPEGAGVTASADGMIRFVLLKPHFFRLNGGIERYGAAGYFGEPPDTNSFVALVKVQGPIEMPRIEFEFQHEGGSEFTLFEFDLEGVLPPGEYALDSQMLGQYSYGAAPVSGLIVGGSDTYVYLTLTPVPEPGGWQLLAIGTALVAGGTGRRCGGDVLRRATPNPGR